MTAEQGKAQICESIKPGKKSATIFGCIRPAGHKGPHINSRNEGWLSRLAPEPQEKA